MSFWQRTSEWSRASGKFAYFRKISGSSELNFNFSESHFNKVKELLESETGGDLDLSTAIGTFKTHLSDEIKRKFISHWDYANFDNSLAMLEFSKANCMGNERKWRPTNENTEEQMRPVVLRSLRNKKKFLQRQLEHQTEMIETLVPQIEHSRVYLQEKREQRKQLVEVMKGEQEKCIKEEEQLAQISKIL